jgi:two-component system, response regulator PdtaR
MALCVLIVEDEPLIAMDLRSILEEAGFEIAGVASRMSEAMAIAAQAPLDIAIMDYHIAGRHNGVDVARRLREEHGVGSLFVSANLDDQLRAMAAEWQPVGFIGKPFLAEQITKALHAAEARLSSDG